MTDGPNRSTRRALLGGAAAAARIDGDLIALRRDLRADPEAPGDERRTAAAVADLLTTAGLTVTTGVGGHGVVGILTGRRPGWTVAYRADMDAVPPGDQIGGGGAPDHLCGHDIHTTVGVGVARTLAELRHRLAGTVVFVFQPAEETLLGAQAMLDDGVLSLTRPEEIHALHCGPMPVGSLPFSGEDFALFLDRLPGTYTYLGVRAPGAGIETSFPHFGSFEPDERAIGIGVRAMAGWLATRARRG